ncbi:baeRF11 domain-containing protein [Sediminivirga luteola]|nr:hypothetical protein [Sediminivirga luteola]
MLHTDIPSPADIKALADVRAEPAVSIYVPTSPVPMGPEGAGRDKLAVKNAFKEAAAQLEAAGQGQEAVGALESHVEELLADEGFWRYLSTSLAVFLTTDSIRTYRLPNRLSEAVEVSDRFFLTPLLRAVTFPHTAFVLALAQNSVRLIEISPDAPPAPVQLDSLPADIESALGAALTEDTEPSLRLVGEEGKKVRLRQFARAVDRGLRPLLTGRTEPLILAATEPLSSIYRAVNSYAHLADDDIDGNPEGLPDSELDRAAREVLDRIYRQQVEDVRQRLEDGTTNQHAALDLQQVARAATYGAVETLLVDIDGQLPGLVDEQDGTVTLHEDGDALDHGVLDEIARRVLLTGGRVLAVRAEDIPEGASAAAVLRFPV